MTKHQILALFGIGLLLASMTMWVTGPIRSAALLLFPSYAAAPSAAMLMIGSLHTHWHLRIIRQIIACALLCSLVLGLWWFARAVFSSMYHAGLGCLFGLPSMLCWRWLYVRFNRTDDHKGAIILTTGGIATFVVALTLVLLQLFNRVFPANTLATTGLAAVGALLVAIGGNGWQHELRNADTLPKATVN